MPPAGGSPLPDVSRAITPAAPVSAPPPAVAAPAPAAPRAAPAKRGGVAMDAAELARTPDGCVAQLFVLFFILVTATGGGAVLGIPWVLVTSGESVATLRNFAVGEAPGGVTRADHRLGGFVSDPRVVFLPVARSIRHPRTSGHL